MSDREFYLCKRLEFLNALSRFELMLQGTLENLDPFVIYKHTSLLIMSLYVCLLHIILWLPSLTKTTGALGILL